METRAARSRRMRNRAALLAGAAAAALLAWGWMKPADGKVPGWEPVNGQVSAAVASLSAEGNAAGPMKQPLASVSESAAADPAKQTQERKTVLQASGASAVKPGDGETAEQGAPGSSAAIPPIGSGSGMAAGEGSQSPVRPAEGSPAQASSTAGELININAATAGELDALPGIGPAKAEAIVQYREAHGRFGAAEDLKNVKGIGDKLLANILPLVTAG